jgi:hypothetical protein
MVVELTGKPSLPQSSGGFFDGRLIGLLGVALRAQPRDLTITVHPVVNVGLTLETRDFSRFSTWVIGDDGPVIISVANRKVTFVFAMRHYGDNGLKREPALTKNCVARLEMSCSVGANGWAVKNPPVSRPSLI